MPEFFQARPNGQAGTPRVLVLAYHAITPTWQHPLAIHPDRLRKQLRRLQERGFRGATFTAAATGEPDSPLVAVTFDDAFRSTVEWGVPVLEELGWPATVFTVTRTASSGEPMRWLVRDEAAARDEDIVSMPWSELRELSGLGWEIGSHGTSHRLLSELDDTELKDELTRSRAEITEHIGECTSISYPWGEVVGRVVSAAREAGYRAGSGLAGRFRANDPMAMPRFAVSAADGRLRYGLKTSSFLWNLRATPVWSWLDNVRHVPIGGSLRRALILDGGSGPALSTTRSLGRAGWEVVAPAGTRSAASKYATAAFPIPDAADDPAGFVTAVEDLLQRAQVDVVVPCTDASVTLLRANERILQGARLLGGDEASTQLGLDKADTLTAAERVGFPVPAWLVPKGVDQAREALARLGLPAVVKPRRSYLAQGSTLVHRRSCFVQDPARLDDALEKCVEKDSLPVLQAFVPGRSVAVTAVLREGRLLAFAARETFSFIPIGGGTSVWKRTIPPDDVGVQEALDLLRGIGYEGLAEVEYQVDADGVPRLMEIGVRVHGWIGLAVSAGVDLPVIAARALLGDELPDAAPYRVGTEMRWPAGELRRIGMAFDPRVELPPGTSRGAVLAKAWPPWRPGMRYDGIDFRDLAPWLPQLFRLRRRRSARSIERLARTRSSAAPSIRS